MCLCLGFGSLVLGLGTLCFAEQGTKYQAQSSSKYKSLRPKAQVPKLLSTRNAEQLMDRRVTHDAREYNQRARQRLSKPPPPRPASPDLSD
mgnify:CR=1 FL=1